MDLRLIFANTSAWCELFNVQTKIDFSTAYFFPLLHVQGGHGGPGECFLARVEQED